MTSEQPIAVPAGPKQTIDDVDVADRRVLVRVDFNVPMHDGKIVDDRRIRAALPTLRRLQERRARTIVVTHLGRPKGGADSSLSVEPLARRLGELLGVDVRLGADVAGPASRAMVDSLAPGDVGMIENVRFDTGEERNDPGLSERLAGLGEVYVNDAFGTAHRAHASTEGVAHHLPAVAGYLMAEELRQLGAVLDAPKRPLVAILGGSKISSKLGVLRALTDRVDTLWVGGAMACTFYKALGEEVGRSLVEDDQINVADGLLRAQAQSRCDLRLPVDVVVATSTAPDAATKVVSWKEIPADMTVVDIGPDTVLGIAKSCQEAATIVWNGPLGIYEIEAFARGTRAVADTVASSDATTIIGGGDLSAALEHGGIVNRISHVSTGGGATLEFLEGRTLPGVAALNDRVGSPAFAPGIVGGARLPLVVGNWKMNTSVAEGIELARAVAATPHPDGVEVVVLPPFTHLWPLHEVLANTRVGLGAQDVFWEDSGAFTGEVSPAALSGWCPWVLVGHSERRHLFGEADAQVGRKLRRALAHGLRVIVAVGETLDEREEGDTIEVVRRQLDAAFAGVVEDDVTRIVVAYEPVWAIGTGRTASTHEAQLVCHAIRRHVAAVYSEATSASLRILYGGSVTPDTAAELFGAEDIDGGLIGGASLKPDAFAGIVAAGRVPVAAG